MREKLKWDIECDNFTNYFIIHSAGLTPQAKEQLPKELLLKLFRKGNGQNINNTSSLNFLGKLYVLYKSLRKRWFLVIEDEANGMSAEDFVEFKKKEKKRTFSVEDSSKLTSIGTMILGNKDLCNSFSYLNELSTSPAYNFVTRQPGMPKSGIARWHEQSNYIARFIANYEGMKKKWIAEKSINMTDFLILLASYNGQEIACSELYKSIYPYGYFAGKTQIKRQFRTLQFRGYVIKTGVTKMAKIIITPLGKSIVDEIFDKYVLR